MIEVRINECEFAFLGNEVLCALHTLKQLRDAGIPATGVIALVGVNTGKLTTWCDDSGLDGDEYVFRYEPAGMTQKMIAITPQYEGRFHEDGFSKDGDPFAFGGFIERMRKVVPMRSYLSPHAVTEGKLTMWRDETLDGDEYVYTWISEEL